MHELNSQIQKNCAVSKLLKLNKGRPKNLKTQNKTQKHGKEDTHTAFDGWVKNMIPGIAEIPETSGNVRLKYTPKKSQKRHMIGNAAAASRTFIISKHHGKFRYYFYDFQGAQ